MVDSIVKVIVEVLSSPVAVSVIVGVVMFFVRSLLKEKSAAVEAVMAKAVDVAYALVSEVAPKTETKVDDQIVVFLKAFKDYFAAHGMTPTPAQLDKAQAMFKAMAGHS